MIEFAYAATSGAANPSGGGMSILMIVLMVAIFYFMLIRPESKRKKQAEEMRSSLQKGDWLTPSAACMGASWPSPIAPWSSRPARTGSASSS